MRLSDTRRTGPVPQRLRVAHQAVSNLPHQRTHRPAGEHTILVSSQFRRDLAGRRWLCYGCSPEKPTCWWTSTAARECAECHRPALGGGMVAA